MNFPEFAQHMMTIGMRHKGSVISWGRSEKRNDHVDGHPNSLHLYWLACDIVFDDSTQACLAGQHATRQGIWWKWNGNLTIHFQALKPPVKFDG